MAHPLESQPPPRDEQALESMRRLDLPGRFNELDVIERHWPRLLGFLAGQVLPPYEVLIHTSSACNLRCEWCIGDHVPSVDRRTLKVLDASKSNPERLPDVYASTDAMRRTIQGILDYETHAKVEALGEVIQEKFRIEAVSFSGLIGEPLTHRASMILAIHLLADAGRRVGLFTNGILMDQPVREALLRAAYVLVSVDAATPETYARLKYGGRSHGGELYLRALDNVRALSHLRASLPGSRLQINASFILYPENYGEVFDAALRTKELGVSFFRVKQDNSGTAALSPHQIAAVHRQLDRVEEELVSSDFRLVRIHRDFRPSEVKRRFSRCTITELMAAVGSDGHLYPCNYHPRPGGVSYGSVVDAPFEEVWAGVARARLKRGLPHVCPRTCDPFKNRANHLLAGLRDVLDREGEEAMRSARRELLAPWVGSSPGALLP